VLALGVLGTAQSAQAGEVHNFLTGASIDPHASILHIVPPRGGTVMLYRNAKLVGWWMQPGIVRAAPGKIYGVVATRGQSVLFNAHLIARPGTTSIAWRGGDTPAISFVPSYLGYDARHPAYAHAHGHGGSHSRAATQQARPAGAGRAPAKAQASGADLQRMRAKLDAQPNDAQRMGALRRYLRTHKISRKQSGAVVARFHTRKGKLEAASAMR
jgi:hypothetical protein